MLNRKDYKAIAEIINHEYTRYDDSNEDDSEGKLTTISIAGQLSGYFTADDPRFDRDRFMKACGL